MKFYDRDKEINYLREMRRQAETSARFTVVTGRRRIGKTSLVLKAYEDEPMLYFFVARKAEADLCESFAEEIERVLNVPVIPQIVHYCWFGRKITTCIPKFGVKL